MQNELLKVMALSLLRDIASSVQDSSFYTVTCDECKNAPNKQQVVICIRWISNSDLEVHEDVIGLYTVDNT